MGGATREGVFLRTVSLRVLPIGHEGEQYQEMEHRKELAGRHEHVVTEPPGEFRPISVLNLTNLSTGVVAAHPEMTE